MKDGSLNRPETKERYSLVDIDDRLQYVPELSSALGVNPSTLLSHILTALKSQLNNEIRKTSATKRRRLLEYLFPYVVLEDYSPSVVYMLEKEEDIPEVVMNKLLHDKSYEQFLTPIIKAKIYLKRDDYFQSDFQALFSSQPSGISVKSSVLNKYRFSNEDTLLSQFFPSELMCRFFLMLRKAPSMDPFLQMVANDKVLTSRLFFLFLHTLLTSTNISSEARFHYFELVFEFIKERRYVLVGLAADSKPSNRSIVENYVNRLFADLDEIHTYDRTFSIDSTERVSYAHPDNEKQNICYSIFTLLDRLNDTANQSDFLNCVLSRSAATSHDLCLERNPL